MSVTCFDCGSAGHIAANCPNTGIDGNGRPSWCGICDEATRHIQTAAGVARCQECHPLARRLFKSDRRCPSCRQLVYEWDHSPCGSHSGPSAPDRRPEREHIQAIVATASSTGKE